MIAAPAFSQPLPGMGGATLTAPTYGTTAAGGTTLYGTADSPTNHIHASQLLTHGSKHCTFFGFCLFFFSLHIYTYICFALILCNETCELTVV